MVLVGGAPLELAAKGSPPGTACTVGWLPASAERGLLNEAVGGAMDEVGPAAEPLCVPSRGARSLAPA